MVKVEVFNALIEGVEGTDFGVPGGEADYGGDGHCQEAEEDVDEVFA